MNASGLKPYYFSGLDGLCRWSTVALGACIPVSVALDNSLLAVILAGWLAGLRFRAKLVLVWNNPVCRAAFLLFGVLLLGSLHADVPRRDVLHFLSKYLDLVMISVLAWIFVAPRARSAGLLALAGALAITLLMSFSLKAGLTPRSLWLHGTPEFPIVFKSRLTHNILMAFAAFLFIWHAIASGTRKGKVLWGALAVLALVNVTLMVEGATGYVLLVALALLLGWQYARWRGVGFMLLAAAAAIAALSAIPGPFQTRARQIASELKLESAERPASTSTGFRLEFYRNTLLIIGKNPLIGTGTGSFPSVYAAQVTGTGQVPARNPHNEFLLITVQAGLVGLASFVFLLWQQWRFAPMLPTALERGIAQGLVVTMIVVCMLNSALLDHTEGLLYAWLTALLYAGLSPGNEAARNAHKPSINPPGLSRP
jgi:O-antigen ligase